MSDPSTPSGPAETSEPVQPPEAGSRNKNALALTAIGVGAGIVIGFLIVGSGVVSVESLRRSLAGLGTVPVPSAEDMPDSEPLPATGPRDVAQNAPTKRPAPASPSASQLLSQPASEDVPAAATPPRSGGQETLRQEGSAEAPQSDLTPTFDIVRVEPDGSAVLAGLSAPGDRIEIMSGETVLAKATANPAGEWALVLDEPLPAGGHQLVVRSTSDTAEEPVVSVQSVTVGVPERSDESAIVMLDRPGKPSTVWQSPATVLRPEPRENQSDQQSRQGNFAGLEPPAGAGPANPSEAAPAEPVPAEPAPAEPATADTPAAGPQPSRPVADPENPLVTVETIETEGAQELFVSGASRPDATVRLYFDNKLVGEAKAGPVGRWRVQASRSVPDAGLKVRADLVQPETGTVLARREVAFQRQAAILGALTVLIDPATTINADIHREVAAGQAGAEIAGVLSQVQRVVVDKGDNLWAIARRLYGRGVRYTVLYSANEDQIRDPALIFPGQVLAVPEDPKGADGHIIGN